MGLVFAGFFFLELLSVRCAIAFALSASTPPRTMADRLTLGVAAPMGRPGCPCCYFPADLFLPASLASGGDEGGDNDSRQAREDALPRPQDVILDLIEINKKRGAAFGQSAEVSERTPMLSLVDTHGHPHLGRERQEEYAAADEATEGERDGSSQGEEDLLPVLSLTCAVEQSDWATALEYASKTPSILPALGVHPWYLADLSESYLTDLRALLEEHPGAFIGEIGLCKMARFLRTYEGGKEAATAIQRDVFREQFVLAAELGRPVTVHCVGQHGVMLKMMQEIRDQAIAEARAQHGEGKPSVADAECILERVRLKFPPAIGMHSFTGTAHHVQELLAFEESLYDAQLVLTGRIQNKRGKKKKGKGKKDDDGGDGSEGKTEVGDVIRRKPIFYFGFSHVINVLMCTSEKSQRQGREAMKAVPADRILAESDVHHPSDVAVGTAGAVGCMACVLDVPLERAAEMAHRNGLEFLRSFRRAASIVE